MKQNHVTIALPDRVHGEYKLAFWSNDERLVDKFRDLADMLCFRGIDNAIRDQFQPFMQSNNSDYVMIEFWRHDLNHDALWNLSQVICEQMKDAAVEMDIC